MQFEINANLEAPSFYKTDSLQTANYQNQYACENNSLLKYINYNTNVNTLTINAPVNINNNIIAISNVLSFNDCIIISPQIYVILTAIHAKIPPGQKTDTTKWQTLKYYNFLKNNCNINSDSDFSNFLSANIQ